MAVKVRRKGVATISHVAMNLYRKRAATLLHVAMNLRGKRVGIRFTIQCDDVDDF